jgi:hypothetical protein
MSDGISDGQAYRAGASLEGKNPRRQLHEAGSNGTMNIPEYLKAQYELHKKWLGPLCGRRPYSHGSVEAILRSDAVQMIERIAKAEQALAELKMENIQLLNSASVWRNRAINAEEELAGTNRLKESE